MRICKTFTFDAAHRLDKLPATHKCHNMHGHTYRVDITVGGHINEFGWILDYADIAAAWQPLHDLLDHHVLNEIDGLETPTTEELAKWIYGRLAVSLRGEAKPDAPWAVSLRGEAKPDAPWEGAQYWVACVRVYESSSTYCEFP